MAGLPEFEQPRDLAFINARGGIKVDQPYRKGDAWFLPVNCNMAGTKKITHQPVIWHSKLAWSKSVVNVAGSTLSLTVYTAMQDTSSPSPNCGPAELPWLEEGVYTVEYVDPDGTRTFLAQVTLDR